MTSSRTEFVPLLPRDVLRRCQPSDNPFVLRANEIIGQVNEFSTSAPAAYRWRYRTSEAFKAEVADLHINDRLTLGINLFYWQDQLGNWEAYSVMNAWRLVDLARSCVWALTRRDIVCATLLGRAALENSVQFVDAVRKVCSTILGPADGSAPSPILDPKVDLAKDVIVSEELEKHSLKVIFASRLPSSDKMYKAVNVVTVLERISKVRGQGFIKDVYELLCEVAHPNFIGRSLYVQASEPGPYEGSEVYTLGRSVGSCGDALVQPTVAALSWACATQLSAFSTMRSTIQAVTNRLRAHGAYDGSGTRPIDV